MTAEMQPDWLDDTARYFSHPGQPRKCPACAALSLRVEWNIVDILTREAEVSLVCGACAIAQQLRIVLPPSVPEFCPLERMLSHGEAFFGQIAKLVESVREHEKILPAATWMIHPGWLMAGWSAMAYQWHPTSEAPPVLGLAFENPEVGREIFQCWINRHGHQDELDEIRISCIEGDVPGQDPGYSIHICPDPDNALVRATMEGVVLDMLPFTLLGQVRRFHPLEGESVALSRFKEEFARHQEFLLAPVERRDDGKLWAIPELGIIKTGILFRDISEIQAGDIDSPVLRVPLKLFPQKNDV